jgi:hypothetical protein
MILSVISVTNIYFLRVLHSKVCCIGVAFRRELSLDATCRMYGQMGFFLGCMVMMRGLAIIIGAPISMVTGHWFCQMQPPMMRLPLALLNNKFSVKRGVEGDGTRIPLFTPALVS